MEEVKICEYCGKEIDRPVGLSNYNWNIRKFCNSDCSKKAGRGTFKKGNNPWNKGREVSDAVKKAVSRAQKGRVKSEEEREIHSRSMKKYWESEESNDHTFLKGENHPNWLGDKVSYRNCHAWVRRNYEKTGFCEHCGLEKRTEWSNKDHKYKRVRKDWQELCRSCHIKYDKCL